MLLKPAPISSSKFAFSRGAFVAEVSDMRDLKLGRVYDDAGDMGFTIISEKTGNAVVFAQTEDTLDKEGDLFSINFVAVTPGFTHLKVVIFND
jgi:hypothetical protein